ncbi:MAG: hypothetical protein WA268_15875 [Xanthobacteraceae bacterium]
MKISASPTYPRNVSMHVWPIEERKRRLAALVRGALSTIVLYEQYEDDGTCLD